MLEPLAAALQASGLSEALRASVWLYPLVNTGHVVGIALLFGAIVPLDLRLIGAFRAVPLKPLATTLVPMAMAGLLLALSTGALLFVTRPLDYVVEPLFGIKLALLAAAVLNALWLRLDPHWPHLGAAPGAPHHRRWRLHGVLSVLLWLGVITAGRLIGYR
jgi:hypothetical protein